MSNNFREQAAYDYIHDNGNIKEKHLWSIKNKWKRHNCEIAEDRAIRNKEKDKQQNKEMKNDLNSYYEGHKD